MVCFGEWNSKATSFIALCSWHSVIVAFPPESGVSTLSSVSKLDMIKQLAVSSEDISRV
jgi:hypothetical protein